MIHNIEKLANYGKLALQCHIAKSNPQWEGIEDQEVLITFQGPYDYESPSWYNYPGVPNWNYQSVHIYRQPQLITKLAPFAGSTISSWFLFRARKSPSLEYRVLDDHRYHPV